jgi:hypothetical protein
MDFGRKLERMPHPLLAYRYNAVVDFAYGGHGLVG